MTKKLKALLLVLAFIGGAASAVLIPRLVRGVMNRFLFPEHREEVERITSPDGTVDAVLQLFDCGEPCSRNYAVSIVPRGDAAPTDPDQQVFLANDAVQTQLRWKEPHLLDIAYERAFIESFRNVTYPLGRRGNEESWRYAVEIHLSPSSARFSYLADGDQTRKTR